MGFDREDLTRDRFLDGKLNIWQPKRGHRAGIDPVLLAASVDARAGQSILELGCGAGVASLCLAWRVKGLSISGVELQNDYAELARINGRENNIYLDVVTADLTELPSETRHQVFDHVFANPPYYSRKSGTAAADNGRDTALAGTTPLEAWIDVATRRLKPGGFLTFIQKSDRLQDMLGSMDRRLGSVLVKPVAPRVARPAELVMVQARKGGRAAFRLLAPLILHIGPRHERDGDSYTPEVRAILRGGAPLEIAS